MSGDYLNRKWNIGAQHALYHQDGTWYHQLRAFPGALCDRQGYVLFRDEARFRDHPGVRVTHDVNVPGGIASLPEYVRVAEGNPPATDAQPETVPTRDPMRDGPAIPDGVTAAELREWLERTFADYGYSMQYQGALLNAIVRALQDEVREQCAAVASEIGDRQTDEAAMVAADAIARAIRCGRLPHTP